MLNHFHSVKNGRNIWSPLWISGAGTLLLLVLLTLTPGQAFAFNGTVNWSGWNRVLRSEAPAAPAPTPTANAPAAADFSVTPSSCTFVCVATVTRFVFVREGDSTIDFISKPLNGTNVGWSTLNVVPGNGLILDSPSAIQFGGTLYLFAEGTNHGLYMTTYNGSWLGHWVRIQVGGVSVSVAASPASVIFNNKLYVFARQSDSSIIDYTSSNGSTWTGATVPAFTGMGTSVSTSTAPAAVVSDDGNFLYLFIQGPGNIVWGNSLVNIWSNWQPALVAGNMMPTTASPAAVLGVDPGGNVSVDLFTRQTDESVQWFTIITPDGLTWTGQGEVPSSGRIINAPFAISGSPGSPSLFVEGTDGNVWENDQIVTLG